MKFFNKKDIFSVWLLCLSLSISAWAVPLGGLAANELAVFVENLDTGRTVMEHRADEAVNPASTMKLLTAAYAVQKLSPAYRIATRWYAAGNIKDGVLDGDLVWVGSGDPTLDYRALDDMMRQLQTRGVRHINGQLVLDKSLWRNIPDAADFPNDQAAAFTVAPHTHMLDYHVAWLQLTGTDAPNWQMPLPQWETEIDDSAVEWQDGEFCPNVQRRISTQQTAHKIRLRGSVNPACIGQKLYSRGAVGDEFVFRAFRGMWQTLGGSGADSFRSSDTPEPRGMLLAEHRSAPLADAVNLMNKYSNNVIARSLLLLAAQADGGSVNGDDALRQMQQYWTDTLGADSSALVLENGSGLSRQERVTARLLGRVLERVYAGAYRQVLWDSLPTAGVDGTLSERLRPFTGRLHLKTGTLDGVHALAGYGSLTNGETLAIVVVFNGRSTPQITQQMDALVGRIIDSVDSEPQDSAQVAINLSAALVIRRHSHYLYARSHSNHES